MGKSKAVKRLHPDLQAAIANGDPRRVQQLLSRNSPQEKDWQQINLRMRHKTKRSLFGYLIEKRSTTVFNIVVGCDQCTLPFDSAWIPELIEHGFIGWEFASRMIRTGWPTEVRGELIETVIDQLVTLDRLENEPDLIPHLGSRTYFRPISTPTFDQIIERESSRRVEAFYTSMIKNWPRWSVRVHDILRPGLIGRPLRLLKPYLEPMLNAEVAYLVTNRPGIIGTPPPWYVRRHELVVFLFGELRKLQKPIALSDPMFRFIRRHPETINPDQISTLFVQPSISRLLDRKIPSEVYAILPLKWLTPVELKIWVRRSQKSGHDDVWRILKRIHRLTEVDPTPDRGRPSRDRAADRPATLRAALQRPRTVGVSVETEHQTRPRSAEPVCRATLSLIAE